MENVIVRLHIEKDNKGLEKKELTLQQKSRRTLWEIVKVPRQRSTKKGRGLSWDLKVFKSKSSKKNGSTVGRKVTNLFITDYQRGTNLTNPI